MNKKTIQDHLSNKHKELALAMIVCIDGTKADTFELTAELKDKKRGDRFLIKTTLIKKS